MAVTMDKLTKAIFEANRFLLAAENAKQYFKKYRYAGEGCKETGAVRRASMDLTRSLVEIRK